jgi:hypothetical protein
MQGQHFKNKVAAGIHIYSIDIRTVRGGVQCSGSPTFGLQATKHPSSVSHAARRRMIRYDILCFLSFFFPFCFQQLIQVLVLDKSINTVVGGGVSTILLYPSIKVLYLLHDC